MVSLEPWKLAQSSELDYPDQVKRFVFQAQEEALVESLPRVLEKLPKKATVQGMDSPHQNGDHVAYEMLVRHG